MAAGKVEEMEVFLLVTKAQTFSGAARLLDLTPSAVSKLVTRLERRLGVTLFERTSRGLALTREGASYREHVQRLLAELDVVERMLAERVTSLRERVRVVAPREFAEQQLAPELPGLCALHSDLEIEICGIDDASSVAPRTDVEICIGEVHDDSRHIRRMGTSRTHVVASPEYLRRHGTPARPVELSHHNCLRSSVDEGARWLFVVDGASYTSAAVGSVRCNTDRALLELARSGLGIAALPDFMIARDVREGRLVLLLEEFRPACELPVCAAFVAGPSVTRRVRELVEYLVRRFLPTPPWHVGHG